MILVATEPHHMFASGPCSFCSGVRALEASRV